MAESEPGPAPETARALLGLPDAASPEQLEGAYLRLRAHIEGRLQTSRDAGSREARRRELDALDAAILACPGIDPGLVASPASAQRRTRVPRWLVAWAALATAAVVALLILRFAALPGPGAPGSAEQEEPAAGAARLVVTADPPSARLTVTTGEDARVVASGAADGQAVTLPPGTYALAVSHPDCPDAWSQSATLEAGEERSYAPTICRGEGRLVVRSNVSEDRVRIDGVDVGSTGATPRVLRAGAHEVRVEKEGFEPWGGEVRIEPGGELTLHAELVASGEGTAPARAAPPSPPVAAAAPAPGPASAPDEPPRQGADVAGGMIDPTGGGHPMPVRTGKGGSKSWHDAIKADLISQFDRNGSGSLDTPAEVDAISCETWRNIEQSYETGGLAVEMTHLYGFDGSEAPANTLGIALSVRDHAYERMKACGLKARR